MRLGLAVLTLGLTSPLYAERPMTVAYDQILVGGIAQTANTIVTCDRDKALAEVCDRVEALDGRLVDNNNTVYTRWVDIDEDASTYNSSAGTLTLPAQAAVEWATLYWVGTDWTTQQSHILTQAATTPKDRIKLKAPGQTDYTELEADWCDLSEHHLVCARQVTALVAQHGAGQYIIADLPTNTGLDDFFGGWELKVAYRTYEDRPPRHVLISHGSMRYGTTTSAQLSINDARQLAQGTLRGELTISTAEGDAGVSDVATYEGTPLGLGLSPADDLGNGSICDERGNITSRTPAYVNTLGLDQDTFDLSALLVPDATTATIELSSPSNGESNTWFALAYQATTQAPQLTHTLANTPTTQPIEAESEVTFTATISAEASSSQTATSLAWELPQPEGLAYLPGTLTLTRRDATVMLTDADDDDQGSFDQATGRLRVAFKEQAQLGPGEQFKVSARFVMEPLDAATTLSAQAQLTYQAQALQERGITRTITLPSAAPPRGWTTDIEALPAPTLTIESPQAQQRLSATTLMVTGRGPRDQALSLDLDGQTLKTAQSDDQGRFSIGLEGLSPGPHTVTISSRYQRASASFTIEQAPLFVTITEPAQEQVLPPSFVIRGQAVPGAIVEAFISGESLAGSSVGQDGRWAIVAQGLPVARHTLGVTATKDGQTVSAPIITFYVEAQASTPPTKGAESSCAHTQPHHKAPLSIPLTLLLGLGALKRRRLRSER